ncbi:hypothetical protein ANTQUA_LOCUS4845 [Anthophora quadrimaculata]
MYFSITFLSNIIDAYIICYNLAIVTVPEIPSVTKKTVILSLTGTRTQREHDGAVLSVFPTGLMEQFQKRIDGHWVFTVNTQPAKQPAKLKTECTENVNVAEGIGQLEKWTRIASRFIQRTLENTRGHFFPFISVSCEMSHGTPPPTEDASSRE